jgi:phospholipase/carboxylesterase
VRTVIADLEVEIVGADLPENAPTVVLLHGYDGFASDLSPFAASFRLPTVRFVFPQGPLQFGDTARGGHAWWRIDPVARRESLARGPRDLSRLKPEGLERARIGGSRLLDELGNSNGHAPLILGGFSQGAMLACDLALRSRHPLAGLVLLSGARICQDEWAGLYASRSGLPTFLSHGRGDRDLEFAAAERLRDDLTAGELDVTWLPFEGGHEIPLIALRGLKRFLAGIVGESARAPA